MTKKMSFFDRLSGGTSSAAADAFDDFDDAAPVRESSHRDLGRPAPLEDDLDAPATEGQLPVDVHQTASDIVIRAFVAGVRPEELSISIGRDMVEIAGSRNERHQVSGPDFYVRELFWGSFARTITLPQEVDVEAASATAKDGLLTIILPKLDRAKQTKLKVKAG